MNFAFGLLILACGSLPAIVYQLGRAPEGFEDETGFHFSPSTGHRLPAGSGLPLGVGVAMRAALFQALSNVSRRRDDPAIRTVLRAREAH